MKYAWIEDGKVREVASGDPAANYTPEIAKHFSELVPDDAQPGDGWDGKTLTKRVVPEPKPIEPAPAPEAFTLEFKEGEEGLFKLFTAQLELARKG